MARASGRGRGRTTTAALGAVCVAMLLLPAAAAAGTWTAREIVTENTQPALYGISCPSTTLCVATGTDNTIVSSTEPTGPAGAWKVVFPGTGSFETGQGPNSFFNGNEIRGVSCPSTGLCVAVSLSGYVYTTSDPTGDAGAWATTDLSPSGPNVHMYGVSCPTTGFCAVAAGEGKIVTSYDPTGGPGAWAVTQMPVGELRDISCSSVTFCVAVGDDGTIAASTAPGGGPGAWQVGTAPAGAGEIGGVACTRPSLCVAGNQEGDVLVSTAPGAAPSTWSTVPSGATVQIWGASCASATECATVDNNADVTISTAPTGGASAWHEENLIPYKYENGVVTYNGTFGISCVPGGELCAISGARGNILTSTDPFAPSAKPNQLGGPTPVGEKVVKRPRARITTAPHRRIRTARRAVRVTFRFRAVSSARGFQCSFDGGRWRRCRAPLRSRAALGRHRFRVRAIGPTGLTGPPAHHRFVVLPRKRVRT